MKGATSTLAHQEQAPAQQRPEDLGDSGVESQVWQCCCESWRRIQFQRTRNVVPGSPPLGSLPLGDLLMAIELHPRQREDPVAERDQVPVQDQLPDLRGVEERQVLDEVAAVRDPRTKELLEVAAVVERRLERRRVGPGQRLVDPSCPLAQPPRLRVCNEPLAELHEARYPPLPLSLPPCLLSGIRESRILKLWHCGQGSATHPAQHLEAAER